MAPAKFQNFGLLENQSIFDHQTNQKKCCQNWVQNDGTLCIFHEESSFCCSCNFLFNNRPIPFLQQNRLEDLFLIEEDAKDNEEEGGYAESETPAAELDVTQFPITAEIFVPPDGGYGWLIAFGAFNALFWTAGMIKSYGVIFDMILKTFPGTYYIHDFFSFYKMLINTRVLCIEIMYVVK